MTWLRRLITPPLTRHHWATRTVWMVRDRVTVPCRCATWTRVGMLGVGW